ncbi:hypothetical protein BS47DRAFT_119830 [Hydnum rufescens UP504]|uniref:Protein Zds1 C-terminal domain-containing protein n=1 Tax=Hydnum rufescens UP504 TaxID=1448309 RepID=A0A9P6B7K8_9AGAM|nr:hypothetical protein BS47DRAFT_119830 [Hydnum rufescens UP504]
MLSRQYRPTANDGVENETDSVISTRRSRGGVFSNAGPQLSVTDLQKLESLAEEAAKSDDPNRLRSVLRRSLSLNQPSVIDKMDDIGGENADEPIIVPPPGQILRRSARTKIRKASLQGDGGGHRFASTRRGKQTAAAPDLFLALDRPVSPESDPSEASSYLSPPLATEHDESEALGWDRPLSFSEESAIYDAYAERRDSTSSAVADDDDFTSAYARPQYETIPPIVVEPQVRPEPEPEPEPPIRISAPSTPTPPSSPPTPDPTYVVPQTPLQHPSPKPPPQGLTPIVAQHSALFPSPGGVGEPYSELVPFVPVTTSPPAGRLRKEKEKKGGLFGKSKWGGEKSDGKTKKDKPKAGGKGAPDRISEKDREREKETGFFGSLFGSKKKHDDLGSMTPGAGPATAAALLGASRSKTNLPLSSESPLPHGSYARYPIHVERAVYRLSHIKLANPRRPLYEQVLISNLMFWYLGIINKPQATPATSPPPAAVQAAKGEKERQEKERLERERSEKEQEKETNRREPRKALTRPPANGGFQFLVQIPLSINSVSLHNLFTRIPIRLMCLMTVNLHTLPIVHHHLRVPGLPLVHLRHLCLRALCLPSRLITPGCNNPSGIQHILPTISISHPHSRLQPLNHPIPSSVLPLIAGVRTCPRPIHQGPKSKEDRYQLLQYRHVLRHVLGPRPLRSLVGQDRDRRDGRASSPVPPLPVSGSIRAIYSDHDQQWNKEEDLPLAFYQHQPPQNQQQYNPSDRDRSYSSRR